MVTIVEGTALVPDYYVSENGIIIKLRPDDMYNVVSNTLHPIPFVDIHEDEFSGDVKGFAYQLTANDGGIDFTAVIVDPSLETEVTQKLDGRTIPNVSAMIVPTPYASFESHTTPEGHSYMTCSDWTMKHISNVEVGRCKPEDGCGIWGYGAKLSAETNELKYDYIDYTVPTGDILTEEPCIKTELKEANEKLGAIELELSELKKKNAELESTLEALKTEKDDIELVLSETKQNLEILEKQEYDETVASVLKLDSEYPLTGDETKEQLQLVLTALRRSSERRKAIVEDKQKDDKPNVVAELKAITGRL